MLRIFLNRTDKSVGRVADWTSIAQLVPSVLFGGGLLSAVAAFIEPVTRLGWGATVFAGLAMACASLLAITWSLAAFRYFRPLPIISLQREIETVSSSQPSLEGDVNRLRQSLNSVAQSMVMIRETMESRVGIVEDVSRTIDGRLEGIERALDPPRGLLTAMLAPEGEPYETRLDYIDTRIARTQDSIDEVLQKISTALDQMRDRAEGDRKQAAAHYQILATSLRARDALAMVMEADGKILQLGGALISDPDLATDDSTWAGAFRAWELQIRIVDGLLPRWTEKYSPFLPLTSSELERETPPVPVTILAASDTNAVRYKTVAIVHPGYCNRRDGIIEFFKRKAGELPG